MRHKPPPPVEIDIIEIFEHDPEVVRLLKEIGKAEPVSPQSKSPPVEGR